MSIAIYYYNVLAVEKRLRHKEFSNEANYQRIIIRLLQIEHPEEIIDIK